MCTQPQRKYLVSYPNLKNRKNLDFLSNMMRIFLEVFATHSSSLAPQMLSVKILYISQSFNFLPHPSIKLPVLLNKSADANSLQFTAPAIFAMEAIYRAAHQRIKGFQFLLLSGSPRLSYNHITILFAHRSKCRGLFFLLRLLHYKCTQVRAVVLFFSCALLRRSF